MNGAKRLRIGPLPKAESTKITFSCSTSLKAELDRYAALHAQTYGETVDAATLIPHMLEAFMAGDRAFKKGSSAKVVVPRHARALADGPASARPLADPQPAALETRS